MRWCAIRRFWKCVGKVLLILLAVILVLGVGIGIWQRDNLKALYLARTQTPEQISSASETAREEQRNALAERGVDIPLPSLEDLERMMEEGTRDNPKGNEGAGETDPEVSTAPQPTEPPQQDPAPTTSPTQPSQAAQPEQAQAPEQTEPTAQPEPTAEPEQPEVPTEQSLIAAATTELYQYEAQVMGRLGALKAQAIEQYRALPKEEQTAAARMNLAIGALSAAKAMEGEVDGQVQSVLNRLRAELREIGADDSIVYDLWNYYCSEKESIKAYYMSKYL